MKKTNSSLVIAKRENDTKQQTDPLVIDFRVDEWKNLKSVVFNFRHTAHSFLRASQRGFNNNKISAALQYGENIFKQGLIYFILGEKNIPVALEKEKEKLKNIVVVVSGDSNQVITCYHSKNPFKHLKTKSKKLFTNYRSVA